MESAEACYKEVKKVDKSPTDNVTNLYKVRYYQYVVSKWVLSSHTAVNYVPSTLRF